MERQTARGADRSIYLQAGDMSVKAYKEYRQMDTQMVSAHRGMG